MVKPDSTEVTSHPTQSKQENSLLSFQDGLELSTFTMPGNPIQAIKRKMTESVSHIIDIIAVFILHVLVIPVLALWMFYRSMQKLVETRSFSSPGSRRP